MLNEPRTNSHRKSLANLHYLRLSQIFWSARFYVICHSRFFFHFLGYSEIPPQKMCYESFRISENYYLQSFFVSSTKTRNKAKGKTRINKERPGCLKFGNPFMDFHKIWAMTKNSLQMCIMFYDNIILNKFFLHLRLFSFNVFFPLTWCRSTLCVSQVFCRPCGITAKFPLVTCKWQWGNSHIAERTHGLSLTLYLLRFLVIYLFWFSWFRNAFLSIYGCLTLISISYLQ